MSDGDSSERDQGGFVFGNDEVIDSDEGASGGDGTSDGTELDTRRIAAALVLSLAIIVLAIVVQPLVAGIATDLFGSDSPSESGNATDTTTAAEPSDSDDTTAETTGDSQTSAATTATVTSGRAPTSSAPMTTTEAATTATATATQTGEDATTTAEDATTSEDVTASPNATATPSGESPVIESFTVTDRSADGNATFDVAWNVSDPNADLASVRVTIVADPGGDARTAASRRFDAGGASTVGSGTFEIEGGSGNVYEVRMEVIDAAGNSVFTLTREVADGDPDG